MSDAWDAQSAGGNITHTIGNQLAIACGRVTGTGLYVGISRTATSADLSGAAETLYMLHTTRAITLYKVILLYTEASSADAGITLKVGKETDDDYYYTGTSEVSKAQYYEADLTLLQTDLAAGDTLIFSSAGGKVGTGEIMCFVEWGYTQ